MSKKEIKENVGVDVSVLSIEDLREKVKDLRGKIMEGFLDLAEVLHRIYKEGYYLTWEYTNFNDYVEREVGVNERRARWLISLWDWYVAKRLNSDGIKELLKKVGWTKATKLIGKVKEEEIEDWLVKATKLSTTELVDELSKYEEGDKKGEIKKSDVSDTEEFYKVSFTLSGEQYENLRSAVNIAAEKSGSKKEGNNVDLIATSFLSSIGVDGQKLEDEIVALESKYNVSIVAIDMEKKEVVYGSENIELLLTSSGSDEGSEIINVTGN